MKIALKFVDNKQRNSVAILFLTFCIQSNGPQSNACNGVSLQVLASSYNSCDSVSYSGRFVMVHNFVIKENSFSQNVPKMTFCLSLARFFSRIHPIFNIYICIKSSSKELYNGTYIIARGLQQKFLLTQNGQNGIPLQIRNSVSVVKYPKGNVNALYETYTVQQFLLGGISPCISHDG